MLTIVCIGGLGCCLLSRNVNTVWQSAYSGDLEGVKKAVYGGADVNEHSRWGWRRGNKGNTLLSIAVRSGSVEVVQFLISKGANPNLPDGIGDGRVPLYHAAVFGNIEIAKVLLKAGADINFKGDTWSPLSTSLCLGYPFP